MNDEVWDGLKFPEPVLLGTTVSNNWMTEITRMNGNYYLLTIEA